MFTIVWQFTVAGTCVNAFLKAYGPDGDWAQLFQREDGFVSTTLLQSTDAPLTYLTIDRWKSEDAFTAFQRIYGQAYRDLDQRLEGLTTAELRIGAFTERH